MRHGIAHHPQPLSATALMLPVFGMQSHRVIPKQDVFDPTINIIICKIGKSIRGITAIHELGKVPQPAVRTGNSQHLYVISEPTVLAPYLSRPFGTHDGNGPG